MLPTESAITVYPPRSPRQRRAIGIRVLGIAVAISAAGLATGVTHDAVTSRIIMATMSNIAQYTGENFQLLSRSLDPLGCMVVHNRIALHYLLAKDRGI